MSGLALRRGEQVRVTLEGPDLVRFEKGIVVGADHTHVKVRFPHPVPIEIKRKWHFRSEVWVHRLHVYPVRGDDVIELANLPPAQPVSAADAEYGARRLAGESRAAAIERTQQYHPSTGPTKLPESADPDQDIQ